MSNSKMTVYANQLEHQIREQAEEIEEGRVTVYNDDCIKVMAAMPADSVDAIVTDPPYGLEFMGKEWDAPWKATSGGFSKPGIGARERDWPSFKGSNLSRCAVCGLLVGQGGSPCRCEKPQPKRQDAERMLAYQLWFQNIAVEALRVLKPGGHLVTFGGTRTYHRLTCALEDVGFEVRDCLSWLYGQGFPKSLDVSKAIDKAAGAERPVLSERQEHDITRPKGGGDERLMTSAGARETRVVKKTAPATDAAHLWSGWGTALKPAWEPIVLARKPLTGTVAANVLEHGTGAINIDACRITAPDGDRTEYGLDGDEPAARNKNAYSAHDAPREPYVRPAAGRFPANVVLDEEAALQLDEQSGTSQSRIGKPRGSAKPGEGWGMTKTGAEYTDAGGASRFFYCAKASSSERNAAGENTHPTVKPVALMRWLVKLVTPPGGVVLDPFMGSGTTGVAAQEEGFPFIGIEREAEYATIARKRLGEPEPAAVKPPEPEACLAELAAERERSERLKAKVEGLLDQNQEIAASNADHVRWHREAEAMLAVEREAHLDLIMQVARKFPGETRHETAKRYIREAEGASRSRTEELDLPHQLKDAVERLRPIGRWDTGCSIHHEDYPELQDDIRLVLTALREAQGVTRADDKRLEDAAIRVWGEHRWGCDTPDQMADTILDLRAKVREQAQEIERLKAERDRQRGAAEKYYALAEARLDLLDHAEAEQEPKV